MTNPLFCVITATGYDEALEEAYTKDISEYLTPIDYYQIAGYDFLTESIYFMFFFLTRNPIHQLFVTNQKRKFQKLLLY